jgi:rhodanese-related sulfurtransferase
MTDSHRRQLVSFLAIIGLGALVGLANNLLAGDARRLDWVSAYPPKGEPGCKKHEAELAAAAQGLPAPGSIPAVGTVAPEDAEPAGSADIPAIPAGQAWVELSPPQVKALFDRGALFIDARRTSAFEEGHVLEAASIPIWESGVDEKIAQVIFHARVQGDSAAPIVVYCNGGDCEDSHMVGEKLAQAGHAAVYVYEDGWPDWTANAWPSTTTAPSTTGGMQ